MANGNRQKRRYGYRLRNRQTDGQRGKEKETERIKRNLSDGDGAAESGQLEQLIDGE